jgi:hypothetical protein
LCRENPLCCDSLQVFQVWADLRGPPIIPRLPHAGDFVAPPSPSNHGRPLLKAVARARRWADELASGKARSVRELARRERIDSRSVRRLMPLGFLSPRIIEAIAEGRQPVELTLEALTRRIDLPLLWSAQEQALGIE